MSEHVKHADAEAISAYIDGEAPEWADHVAGCAVCRASADRMRAVAAAVGAPVDPPDRVRREAAIAAALGDADVESRPAVEPSPLTGRRRMEWRWIMPAAAAVIAVVMAASVLVSLGTRSSDEKTVAGPALEAAPTAGAPPGALSGGSGLAAATADLGDVSDAATLRAKAGAALGFAASQGAATSRANSGAVSDSAATGSAPGGAGAISGHATNVPATPSPSLDQRSVAPNVVGTRPCEEQARAREPGLREVVYFAVAQRGQVPAFVLGFATGSAGSPVTLLLLAQDGCAELLRAAGP